MADFLASMAAGSRARSQAAQAEESLPELRKRALACAPAPVLRLDGRFDIIAELKFASPSEGALARVDVEERVQAYQAGGAAALSVLTEPSRFAGRPEYLQRAATQADVPVMRKDFLVEPYQVYEARAWGAGGVLLIVAMLDDAALAAMLEACQECGLFALLEAFDRSDLERLAAHVGGTQRLCGVNTRNLRSLQVEPERLQQLAPHLPAHALSVAESGLHRAEQVAAAARAGYRLGLVGSALMRAAAPETALSQLLAAGRAAREEA